jgi:hypothetical protein
MNRLHDIHASVGERERRARISAQAAPNLIIDADGFVMYSQWLASAYLTGAIYGTLTLGYTRVLHDGVPLPDPTMRTLGQLMRLSAARPWGQPEFVDYGHWRLWQRGRVVAEVLDAQLLIMFTSDTEGYIFSFEDVTRELSTHSREVLSVTPAPAGLLVEQNRLRASWAGGQLYALTVRV